MCKYYTLSLTFLQTKLIFLYFSATKFKDLFYSQQINNIFNIKRKLYNFPKLPIPQYYC